MGERRLWEDRWQRPGWRSIYTPLGGRLRGPSDGTPAGLAPDLRQKITRLTSQAYLALPAATHGVAPDIEFFAAVALKVLQRGSAPPTPQAVDRVLRQRVEDSDLTNATDADWLAAAIGPSQIKVLDPTIKLDETYEQRLWDRIVSHDTNLARFFLPQPPLEALTGSTQHVTQRWVDFALCPPWLDRTVIIELDGAQHQRARHVDADRDGALAAAGHLVTRHAGPDALNPDKELWKRLTATAALRPPTPDLALTALLHGPAVPTRLAVALVHLLADGHLPPAGVWELDIEDPLDVTSTALPAVLETLAAIAAVWSLDIAPREVRYRHTHLHREGLRYTPGHPSPAPATRARILLEPFTPPHAALPAPDPLLPTAVIRGVYLPVDLPWLPGPHAERRNIDTDAPDVNDGLRILLTHLFGYEDFRDGQLEAIRYALSGDDACILLPTGAGKSLIYQLAGLLRPGVTLVIDPLVSLIDDQERRLRADGIDRLTALHQARVATAAERDASYRAIAGGDSLFVFLTPERLQNQAFRESLGRAADTRLINLAVIDEAHCVSEWGHDFRTAYLRVGRNLRQLAAGNDDVAPPLLALTGTASPAVLRDVMRELEDPERPMQLQRPTSFDRRNLTYQVLSGEADTWRARLRAALTQELPQSLGCHVTDLLRLTGDKTKSGLVFVPHVNHTYGLQAVRSLIRQILNDAIDSTDSSLEKDQRSHIGIYSGQAPRDWPGGKRAWAEDKVMAADRFKDNQTAVLVSTKAFGMGIDKPNIRWTVHVGFPSSIEAFAQEAGRAGRDSDHSHCMLIASPPSNERAAELLNLQVDRERRLEAYNAGRHDDDLQRQLFFLTNSFRGIDVEYEQAIEILDQILAAGPTNRIEIARKDERIGHPGPGEQEKALYRLSMIGVVDDYTVDHGAKKYVIDLDSYDNDHIDRRLMAFIDRVEPGKTSLRRRQLSRSPESLRPRIEHHLGLLLHTLYDVVEPARIRALAEMHQLVLHADSDEEIRGRILAYLSDGPLAGILLELATSQTLDVREATRLLDTVPAENPREWVGAAARQLEAYPDHPILLLVRALGEAMLRDRDERLVQDTTAAAFQQLGPYYVPTHAAVWLFGWAAAQLRNQHAGRGWPLIHLLYQAWVRAGLPDEALAEIEDRVLAMAKQGQHHPTELQTVLHRRLTRHVGKARNYTNRHIGHATTPTRSSQ